MVLWVQMQPAIMVSQTSAGQPQRGCSARVKYSMTRLIICACFSSRKQYANLSLVKHGNIFLSKERLSVKKKNL